MQFKNIFFASVYLSMVVSATPLTSRSPCNPNFEGAGIVFHSVNGAINANGVPSSTSPAWHIQQNGQPSPSYIFKNINNNNQALTLESDGFIRLDTASDSGNDPRQLFNIVCDTCIPGASTLPPGSTVASGCKLKTPTNVNVCVEVALASTNLRVLPCTGSPNQVFWFST